MRNDVFFEVDDLNDGEIWLKLHHTSPAMPEKQWVPAYYFRICDRDGNIMGRCDLRLGHTEGTWYGGNIGYTVFEDYRGHHYAAKACRLLAELAARHEMGYLIITCDPDNIASRRTCEAIGAGLVTIVPLPPDSDMRRTGSTAKCIYRLEL